jgi:hypothetical protein
MIRAETTTLCLLPDLGLVSWVACRVGDQKSVSAGAKRLDSRGAGQEPRLLGLDEFNRFPEPIPSPVVNAS